MSSGSGLIRVSEATGGFDGLMLAIDTIDGWNTVTADGQSVAVIWETVALDTGGYVSTGSHTFLGKVVPAGSALEVPAGKAGYFEVSSVIDAGALATATLYFATDIEVNENGNNAEQFLGVVPSAGTIDFSLGLPITPVILSLADGDVVWQQATNYGDVDVSIVSRSWIVFKRLG